MAAAGQEGAGQEGAGLPAGLVLRRSARARRFTLRVSRADGRVTLTLPARARERDAMAFLHDRADWIRAALAGVPAPVAVAAGALLPVEGAERLLVAAPLRAPRLEGDRLLVPAAAGRSGPAVAAWLRLAARERLAAACAGHAAALRVRPARIVLSDPRSRWGSCSAAGRLMFSWRLAMAPPEVLDYVAAHEVAHLVEMNHGPRFWALVAGLVPDHARRRDWLRREGAGLHRFVFLP
ncbi:MAG: M48 family metallopeptidase [Rhodobacteraceae bacterium]|jgi:predicted metal-dependent hydrolase|nr:M48 family metallopeptidase [Paracoccaceae bacterium]